ncbi:MAG TPA: transferrin receptor-like dimerization domain-containing protein [Terriglobales bacterium]
MPYLNFAPLVNGSTRLAAAAKRFESLLQDAHAKGDAFLNADAVRELNRVLMQAEQAFLSEKGLPERPWYKHQIYAPGAYTGYGVKTVPAVHRSGRKRRLPGRPLVSSSNANRR